MSIFRSKCNHCGAIGSVFPDQIQKIKDNPKLALYKFAKENLKIGSKWLCINCDYSNKNGRDCFIVGELTGEDARKRIEIRKRNTNMESMGFVLPQMD